MYRKYVEIGIILTWNIRNYRYVGDVSLSRRIIFSNGSIFAFNPRKLGICMRKDNDIGTSFICIMIKDFDHTRAYCLTS